MDQSKWENKRFMYGKDYMYDGVSWRQRNFMCNFCKKEYKSAQALGGHMNVHRRDRARLRLSNSPDHPNPSSDLLLSSPPSSFLSLSTPSPTLRNEEKQEIFPFVPRKKTTSIVANVNGNAFDHQLENGSRFFRVEMDLVEDGKMENMGLDLELRLGRS